MVTNVLKESTASIFRKEEGSYFTLVTRDCRFHKMLLTIWQTIQYYIPKDCSFKCVFSVYDCAGFHAEVVIFVL
jgi:hypothetical protein